MKRLINTKIGNGEESQVLTGSSLVVPDGSTVGTTILAGDAVVAAHPLCHDEGVKGIWGAAGGLADQAVRRGPVCQQQQKGRRSLEWLGTSFCGPVGGLDDELYWRTVEGIDTSRAP